MPIADESALAVPGRIGVAGDELMRMLAAMGRPLQILLAEDNATNQVVFAKLLQAFDVEITIAANGRLAVEQASARTFDICVHGHAHARNGRAGSNARDPCA